jgi:hypothetical protein
MEGSDRPDAAGVQLSFVINWPSSMADCCTEKLLTKQQTKNWYRIRVFGDDRHKDDLPREETCIGKAKLYAGRTGYAKVGHARGWQSHPIYL